MGAARRALLPYWPIAERSPALYFHSGPVLRPRFRFARRLQWSIPALLAVAVLFGLPASASADPFYADIDHDGVRDVITIQRWPSSGLEVLLSASGQQIRLPTRRPVLRVAASDVDGDGHLDLLAADVSAVHVWHRSHHGGLKRVRPRRAAPTPGVASPTGVFHVPGERSVAVVTDEYSVSEADAADRDDLPSLNPLDAVFIRSDHAAAGAALRVVHPRGPPTS